MTRALFETLKLLILSAPELEDEELDRVEKSLKENNAHYTLMSIYDTITPKELVEGEYTHIISNTVSFKLYSFSQENLIPVVTSAFVFKTVEKGSQPSIRPFSPDPLHVLKDIHICIGGLSDYDKEAIFGGVRALGGSCSEKLNKFVTHLISMDPDEDCCIAVNSVKNYDIKIVLPHWIDDCLKTRKRLDETPYLLKDDIPSKEQVARVKELDVIKKHYKEVPMQKQFLKDKSFYIGTDLGLSSEYSNLIKDLITFSGGVIVFRIEDAKNYVGQYRDGNEYLHASRNGYNVGNINWIFWMIEYQKWTSPLMKLLHYPFVRGGLPEMEGKIISSTNYSGDARLYILQLCKAIGAKFTPSLTTENTHLVAANSKGRKYEYSLKWNQKVVNHLWLEDMYQKWRYLNPDHPRYSHYPRAITLNDIVGDTPLDPEVLKRFYEHDFNEVTTDIVEDSIGEGTSYALESQNRDIQGITEINAVFLDSVQPISHPPQGTPDTIPYQAVEEPISQIPYHATDATDVSTVEISTTEASKKSVLCTTVEAAGIIVHPENNKTTETPFKAADSTPNTGLRMSNGRKAKDKAATKLHESIEELNFFQKQQKSKDTPLLPDEVIAMKKRSDIDKLAKDKRKSKSSENNDDIENSPAKKKPKASASQLTGSKVYHIEAITTGCDLEFSKANVAILSSLGIHIYREFKNNINTIICPKFIRTEKFLTGLSYKLEYVITPLFIKDVLDTFKEFPSDLSQLPRISKYTLDKTNNASIKTLTDLTLDKLLQKCQKRVESNTPLFKGYAFNVTTKVPGGIATVTKVLKAHGADIIHTVKTLKDMKTIKVFKKSQQREVGVLFICSKSDKSFFERAKELLSESDELHPAKIVDWNWIVESIFNMDTSRKENVLFEV